MVMVIPTVIIVIGAAGNLHVTDFSAFRKLIQISIYCPTADCRMFTGNFLIYFICCGMAVELAYCFQHQGTLNCISLCRVAHLSIIKRYP